MRRVIISASLILITVFLFSFCGVSLAVSVCGNGVREGLEECDNAEANSDSQPNACRRECRRLAGELPGGLYI